MSFHRHSPSLLTALMGAMVAGFGAGAPIAVPPPEVYLDSAMQTPMLYRRRGKGGAWPHRASGAAAIKRAAQKRRNVRARASKRGAR
jgi:hypothetical protein